MSEDQATYGQSGGISGTYTLTPTHDAPIEITGSLRTMKTSAEVNRARDAACRHRVAIHTIDAGGFAVEICYRTDLRDESPRTDVMIAKTLEEVRDRLLSHDPTIAMRFPVIDPRQNGADVKQARDCAARDDMRDKWGRLVATVLSDLGVIRRF